MAIIYMNGAEAQYAGVRGGWESAAGVSINTNAAYVLGGNASFRVNPSNQGPYIYVGDTKNPSWGASAFTWRYASFHMYIATLPGSGQVFYLGSTMTSSGSHIRWAARLLTSGKVDCGNFETSSYNESASALSTGTWYQVTVKYPGQSQTGVVTVRNLSSGTTYTSCSGATTGDPVENAYLFSQAGNSYGDVYIDNIVVDPAADPYTALTSQYNVNILVVTGDGGGNWEDNAASKVDEIPPSTADYDYNTVATWNTETKQVRWAMADTWGTGQKALSSIAAVQATALMKTTSGNGEAYQYVGLYLGSTFYFSGSFYGDDALYWMTRVWETDPSDSAAWTQAKLDAAQAACQAYHNHTSSQLYVYAYFACIEYVGPCTFATLYTSNVSGSMTPAGALANKAIRALAAAISAITGAMSKKMIVPLAGDLATITGAMSRLITRALGGLMESGFWGYTNKKFIMTIAGGVSTIEGVILRAWIPIKGAAGELATIAGDLRALITKKAVGGGITPIATRSRAIARALSGNLLPLGTLYDMVQRALYGTIAIITGQDRGYIKYKFTSGSMESSGAMSEVEIEFKHLHGAERPLHLTSNRRGERIRDEY